MKLIADERPAVVIDGTEARAIHCTISMSHPLGEKREPYVAIYLDADTEDEDAILLPGSEMPSYNQLHAVVWTAKATHNKIRANGRQRAITEISALLHELLGVDKICARLFGIEGELEIIRGKLP